MSPSAPGFRTMRPTELIRLLQREFGYVVVRKSGSHHILRAPDYPQLTIAVHAKEFGPQLVRTILVRDVGLTLAAAKEVMTRA